MTDKEESLSDEKKKIELGLEAVDKTGLCEEAKTAGRLGVMTGADPDQITKAMEKAQSYLETEKAGALHKILPKPKDYTETESILHDMLVQNSGASILDSGSAYGRQWERNRKVADFRTLPAITYRVEEKPNYYGEVIISKQIFHFLNNHLTYDEKEQKSFEAWCDSKNQPKDTQAVEDYVKDFIELRSLVEQGHIEEATFPYGVVGKSDNTYNQQNLLDHDFQYIEANHRENANKLFISIHTGTDIRGGYSDTKCFEESDYDTIWIDLNHCYLQCKCGSVYTDDCAEHWYEGDWCRVEENGLPTRWKPKDEKFVCDRCKQIVEVEE